MANFNFRKTKPFYDVIVLVVQQMKARNLISTIIAGWLSSFLISLLIYNSYSLITYSNAIRKPDFLNMVKRKKKNFYEKHYV